MTIGEAAVRRGGADSVPASGARVAGEERPSSANHGTAQITRGALSTRLATDLDARHPPTLRSRTRAGLDARTSPPRASMNSRAGSAYMSVSGRSGIAIAESRRSGAEHLRRARGRTAGAAAWRGRLVERGQRQRLPQHLAQAAALAVADQPVLDRFAVRRRQPCPCRSRTKRRARRSGAARRNADSRSRSAERVPLDQAAEQVAAARAAAGSESVLARPALVDERHLEVRLDADAVGGADRARGTSKRLVVAAEHQVLAVVHALAGRRIGERRGAPAQRGPRFEHERRARRASASAAAALRPANPPPTTMTSGMDSRAYWQVANHRTRPVLNDPPTSPDGHSRRWPERR